MTGQYAHNHGVLGNKAPQGGFGHLDTEHTLPVWLQRAGYRTIHIGKFLNGYEGSGVGVPPGWSDWHGLKLTYFYYGYRVFEAGQVVTYGSLDEDPDAPAAPETYSTDVLTDKAVQAIDQAPRRGSRSSSRSATWRRTPAAPSGAADSRCRDTAKPAARDIGALDDVPLPQPPNFNEADNSDKPREIRRLAPLTAPQIARAARNYRCRGESMMAIDRGVKRIVDELRAQGELRGHARDLHLRQRVLPRRAPDPRRQEPRLRGGGPGAAPDARPRHPAGGRGGRRGDQRRPRARRSSRRPGQRPTSRSTAARCSRSCGTPTGCTAASC